MLEYTIASGESAHPYAARLKGTWVGRWGNELCSELAVIDIKEDGRADVIYGWGSENPNFALGCRELRATVDDEGTITFGRTGSGATFEFALDGEVLKGVRYHQGR